jgi:hypothetical protein
MNDPDQQFFQPLWRRMSVSLLCLIWTSLEWSDNQPFWGVVSLGLFGYCLWNFFYRFEETTTHSEPEQ